MNDTSPKLTVIATRMPYIDRRSLSQAWFSTLHLASDGATRPAAPERRGSLPVTVAARRAPHESAPAASPHRNAPRPRVPETTSSRVDAEIATRRTYDARMARAARATYERARSYPPFRTSLTLEAGGDRIHLLLRREGATLHVVALCRPEMAETVRRALACADVHVRMRGEAIASSVRVVAPPRVTA